MTRPPQKDRQDIGTTIRHASEADLPDVLAIIEAAYRPYVARNGLLPGPLRDDYPAHLAAGQLWVLEVETQGAKTLRGVLVLIAQPEALLLDNIALHPDAHGYGYGGRMLDYAESHARRTGLPVIRLYTQEIMHENIAIYAARGYAETHRVTELGLRRVYMEKRL